MANPLSTYIFDSITVHKQEMIHKISKLHVMIAARHIDIETFDKRKISIHGIEYSGTLIHIYWSYFDPFIKDYVARTAEEIRLKAIESCVNVNACLNLFRKNMYDTITIIYTKIAETDRLMRGKGYPKKVALRSVDTEINFLCQYVDEKIDAQIDIVKRQKRKKIKDFLLEHINMIIFVFLIIIGFLCEKMGWISLGKFIEMILTKI